MSIAMRMIVAGNFYGYPTNFRGPKKFWARAEWLNINIIITIWSELDEDAQIG